MNKTYTQGIVSLLTGVRQRSLLLTALLMLVAQAGFSQALRVSGTITSSDATALQGASVVVKGTRAGALTDANGKFTVEVPEGSNVLMISYIGYATQEVEINGRTTVDVSLVETNSTLDEVVVVAYGTQKKATVTGAVSAVNGGDLVRSPTVDLGSSLAGRLPGVVVIQTSGEPGNDAASINIRGTNTLGNSSPLVVIDGIPDRDGGLGRLSPQDIESISVLKDAAAAIYGTRAANGVILITTKRGTTGKPTVTYDFNQGFSQPTIVPEMSSAVEYANIMNQLPIYRSVPVNEWNAAWAAIQQTGIYDSPTPGVSTISANYSPEAVRKHGDGSDPWGFPNTDWFDGSFRNWAPQNRHNVQLRGGTENVRYLVSAGYLFQDAIYNNSATFYEQYNMRVNLDANVNKYIKTNVGIVLRREDRNYPTESAGAIFRMLMRGRPTEPQVWPNGKPGPDIENGQNPYVITTNATGYVKDPTDYVQVNGGVDIDIPGIEGLRVSLSGALDINSRVTKTWQTPWELYFWDRISYEADGVTPLLDGSIRSTFTDPRLTMRNSTVFNTNLTGLVSYNRTFGDHTIGALAGFTREEFSGQNFFAFRRNFISPAIDQLFAGGQLLQNTGGSAYYRPRQGAYGRLQYNYQEKYLAEFIWRYDGSYIFPESGRYGFFPGVLVGWNISNENFFNVNAVNFLKLRASFGQMGNDQVFFNGALQEFAYLSTLGFDQFPINSQVVTTLRETVLANPDFTWERANNFNVGLDAALFNNRIDVNLEYFYNRRDQILIQLSGSTPASSGINALLPPVNGGKVDNQGFEFNIGYNSDPSSKVRYRIGVNGGYARNKVVFMDEIPGAPDYQRMEGKQIGAYLVYLSDGVFQNAEEIAANTIDYSGVTSQLIPGDMKFEDYDGNGIIDADDQVRINTSQTPVFNYGANFSLQFGAWDITALLQGALGAAIRLQTESGDIGNFLKYQHDNRWSIECPSSEHPRLASRGDTYFTGGNFGNNTYFLLSKDYIRLKNLEVGYSLPRTLVSKVGINGLRVYANSFNLFTIAANNIFDPEAVAGNGVYYPLNRVINMGASVTF